MDPERWERIQALMAEALELAPSERAAFLRSRESDPEVLAEVHSLLAASSEADEYFGDLAQRAGLVESATDAADGLSDSSAPEAGLIGRRIGAYRLERFLGKGGMGTVYLAQRVDGQFQQRVAIKLLSISAMHAETHRRFLAEREILSRLAHPNIAKLFDGGVTEDGTPYFIMEFVEGAPIDEHCDAGGLDLAERLRAFLEVCEAVAYAHRNLVVHRDLKPANILVSEGRVRLLDFGIAKVLRGDHGPGAETATAHGPMTPAYASPEQLNGDRITTATDVYSLGVVLHELLTGLSPYASDKTSGMGLVRAICEDPVTSPSTRFRRLSKPDRSTTTGERRETRDVEAIARARATSVAALCKRLRGDLDTILLKALQKDPERRYESVADLAEDVRRHLEGFPVQARKDSVSYRTSRFVARHRVAVGACAAGLALLITLVVVSLWFAVTSSLQERRIAEGENRSGVLLTLLTDLYEVADPAASRGEQVATRRLLDQAVERLRGEGIGDPRTQATLLFSAGRIYRRLGEAGEGRALLEKALELRRGVLDAPDEGLAEVLYELGSTLAHTGDVATGCELLREGLAMSQELHGEVHTHVAQFHFELGVALHDLSDYGGSNDAFREAVRIFRASPAEPTSEYADALLSLGEFEAVVGKVAEATRFVEEALEIQSELNGDRHPSVARALNSLGLLRYNAGQKEEGVALLRDSVLIVREVYGEEGHPSLAPYLQNLGNVLSAEGDPEGVERLSEAVDVFRAQPSPSAPSLGTCLTMLGNALERGEDPARARLAYEDAIATFESQDVGPMFQAEAKQKLAALLRSAGQSARAVELLGDVLAAYEGFPPDHPRVQAVRRELEQARRE